jgi:hypothetical protein
MAKKSGVSATALLKGMKSAGAAKPAVFVGMVKAAEDDDGVVLFARAGDCSNWAAIPVDAIEKLEFLRTANCDGHTHPLVQMTMRAPQTTEAKAFAELAALHQAPHAAAASLVQPVAGGHQLALAGMNLPPVRRGGDTPCYFDFGLGRWVCP